MEVPFAYLKDLQSELKTCGIQATQSEHGWRLTSLLGRFDSMTVSDTVRRWGLGEGKIVSGRVSAVFLGAAHRISFRGGSFLSVYPSGHIRWIPATAFRCFALMTGGETPFSCQGDLVVYRLPDSGLPRHYHELARVLPENCGHLWCAPTVLLDEPLGVWRVATELPVGGNGRHFASGRFSYRLLWSADRRSIQIRTQSAICLQHDPVDAVHPTLNLPAAADFLVTKLPGFSNPAAELPSQEPHL